MAVRDALQKETFESDGLDDGFLRDLQREAAVKLERRLVDAARPLDAKAKKAEVDAARVAIALQPAYASAGVKPPPPSRAPRPPAASAPAPPAPLIGAVYAKPLLARRPIQTLVCSDDLTRSQPGHGRHLNRYFADAFR